MNKKSLEYCVGDYCHHQNPWVTGLFAGASSYSQLRIKWKRFVGSKPSPSKKHRKRALVYGLFMVAEELHKCCEEQQKELNEKNDLLALKEKGKGELKQKIEWLPAQVVSKESQGGSLETQNVELRGTLDKRQKEKKILSVQLKESQAAVRQLLEEVKGAAGKAADHSLCERKILKLKEKMKQTRG